MSLDPSLLAPFPQFAGFAPAQLQDLLKEARSLRFARGGSVFTQGARAESFFLLLHGRVRAYRVTPGGEQFIVRFVGPGELFGHAVAIGKQVYPANAVAVVDCVAVSWPSASWPGLIARHPALAVDIMQALGERLQESQQRLSEMSTQAVERRVAHTLLRLASQSGRKTEDGVAIDFPISRQDIAEMTGTTLHTVSRILSAWESDGLVKSGRQKVTLCEPHRLYMLAEARGDAARVSDSAARKADRST